MTSYQTHLEKFLDMAADLRFEDLSPETVAHTERVIYDTICAMLSGSLEPENRKLAELLPQGSQKAATAFAVPYVTTDCLRAAFFNASEATFLEMDEHHRPTGHPGSHVLPSAIAQAEALDSSGKDLITAIVVGYDLAARLANGCVLRDFMHCHGHMGAVGAALANAKLRGFNKEQMRETIHIAAGIPLFSAWAPCFEGATVRNTYTGMAALTGILAADLAQSGYTGLSNALEYTFGELIGSSFDLEALSKDLAAPFQIDTNLFKFHGCCAMNHPPIEAFLDAVKDHPLDWREIDHMVLRVTDRCMRLNRLPAPRQLSTKFSIPFAVATTAYHGHSSPEAFRDGPAGNPEILELASRIYMVPDSELTARWPQDGGASIDIYLKNGKKLHGHVDNPYGWLTRPSNDQDLIQKFSQLTREIYSTEQAQKIFALCDCIADMEHISGFLRVLKEI